MNTGLDIFSHPRSMRLLAGTNEYAEDLTGQRAPMNASQWRSETQVCCTLANSRFFFRLLVSRWREVYSFWGILGP